MPPTVGGLAMKTSLTFCTFKLGSHVQVVERGSDELQRLVEGVGVARACVENVNTLGKRNLEKQIFGKMLDPPIVMSGSSDLLLLILKCRNVVKYGDSSSNMR